MARKSFSERYNERKNSLRAGEEEEKTSSSADKRTTDTKKSTSDKKKGTFSERYNAQKLERSIGLDTLGSDLTSVSEKLNSIYSGWQDADTMKNTKTTVAQMYDRLNNYKTYMNSNATEDMTEFNAGLDTLLTGYKTALDEWDNVAGTYSQFVTPDAYNSAKKNHELSEKYKGLDYAGVQKAKLNSEDADWLSQYGVNVGYSSLKDYNTELHDLSNKMASLQGKEKEELQAYYDKLKAKANQYALDNASEKYSFLKENEDFDLGSQYQSTQSAKKILGMEYTDYGDEVYEFINNVNGARDNLIAQYKEGNGPTELEQHGYEYMTDDEVKMFNYLYRQDKEKAYDFLDDIAVSLSKRSYDKTTETWNQWADNSALASAAMSAATPILNMAGGMGSAIATLEEAVTGKEYNPYSGLRMPSNAATDIRQYVGENIAESTEGMDVLGQNIPSFLYQTGMSIADTTLGASMFGKGFTVVMGTNSATQKAKELKEAGEDEETIVKGAVAAGLAEAAFEKLSIDNLLKPKSAETLFGVLRETAKQMGIEASEEIFTEIANTVSDTLIRQNTSDLAQAFESYLYQGHTEEEAKRLVGRDIASNVMWSGIGGALSGGVMGSFSSAAGYAENASLGSVIRENNNVSDLGEITSGLNNDSYAKYLELIDNEKISNARLGGLYSKVSEEVEENYQTERKDAVMHLIANRAIELGDSKNSGIIASAIQKKVNNQRLSTEEKTALESDTAKVIMQEVMSDELRGKRTGSFKAAYEAKKKLKSVLTTTKSEETARIQNRVAELNTGTDTIDNTTGNKITIEGMHTDEEGNTVLQTSEGERLLTDVTLTDSNAEIIATAEGMDSTKADAFVSLYEDGVDVEQYKTSFELAFSYGQNAFGTENVLKNKGVLTDAQAASAYEAGLRSSTEVQQKQLDEITVKHFRNRTDVVAGSFDDSQVNYNEISRTQKNAVQFAKMLSEYAGMNVVIEASTAEERAAGKYNGFYDPSTNTIHVDVHAGITEQHFEDAFIPTMSHEMTHWLKNKAVEAYNKMSAVIFDTLTMDLGVTAEDLIGAEIAKYAKLHGGAQLTEDGARDEIIARAAEDMLANSKTMQEYLSHMDEKSAHTFLDKVKEFFETLKEWMADLLGVYKSNSSEAKIIRKYADKLNELQEAWDEAFWKGMKANQALNAEGVADYQMAASERQHSDRDVENEINKTTEKVGVAVDLATKSAYPAIQYSLRTWNESEYVEDREKAIGQLSKALDVSKKKAGEYIDNISSVASLIAGDKVRLDYESNIDDSATVVKPNSEYKWSVDMSTLCAKRLLFTGTFDAIQRKLPNTAFDSDDIVLLRQMMKDADYEVACGICYVESTRREIGTITADFIERYKIAQKTGKPIARINSSGNEVELKEKGTGANFYAEEGYTPNLAELNTTDIDMVKKNHPSVYAAYLSYMNARGQAKPKLLETRAEYKGEILKHFKAKSAVAARNAAGGLRLQSFSDFEVPHLIDMMQIATDMSRVGLMSQAYTKVPNFAAVFGDTGIKINLSLIAKDTGLDKNGNLIFDDVEGINHEEAFRLRDQYSKNVGTILVGKNDAHIIKAMADNRIDFIIPFHKSSWKESLYSALGLTGYDDYTEYQNEKPIDKSRKIENFAPSEYWDYSKTGDENAQIYLAKCREDGRTPKFPQFQGYEGYWKLLIDFKMYDNNGVGSPQMPVKPDFNMGEANRVLEEYKGGHRNFPVAEDIVDKFVEDYKNNHPQKQYADRNPYSYESFVNKPDMKVTKVQSVGNMDRKTVVEKALSNARENGFTNENGNAVVHVDDIGKDIIVPKHSITHGMDRRFITQAPVLVRIGEVLKNSIRINELNPRSENISDSYILLGTASDEQNFYTVSFVVNSYTGEVDKIDVLYSSNVKMEPAALLPTVTEENSATPTDSTISIANLLNFVNEHFADLLPEDVLKHYGHDRRPDGSIGKDVLFSDRDSEGNGLTKEQIEYFKDSKVRDENGNLKVMYHGTSTGGFTTFEKRFSDDGRSIFFTDSLMVAKGYSGTYDEIIPNKKLSVKDMTDIIYDSYRWVEFEDGEYRIIHRKGEKYETEYSNKDYDEFVAYLMEEYGDSEVSGNYKVYLNITNPLIVEADGTNWDELPSIDDREVMTTRDYAEYAEANGYDGVIINDVFDIAIYASGREKYEPSTVVIAFDSNQIKSVYNENPSGDADIRYSERNTESIYDAVGELQRIREENEKLKKDLNRLALRNKLESTVGGSVNLNASQIEAVAAYLLKNANSTYGKDKLTSELQDIYKYLQSNEVTWDGLMLKTTDVAQRVVADVRERTVTNDYAKEVLSVLRNTRVSLNDVQKEEAMHTYGNDWRKRYFGRVVVANDGTPLDVMWQEWAAKYPDVFDADISDVDMATALMDAYDTVKASSEIVEAYDTAEMVRDIAIEIYNQFWNVAPIRVLADKYDKAVKQLKYEHRLEMQDMKAKYNQRKTEAVYRTKERYQQTIKNLRKKRDEEIKAIREKSREYNKAYKERLERRSEIDKITKKALKLNTWLVKNSKDAHVPEILKKPVAAVLKSLNFSSERLLGMWGGKNAGQPTNKDISLSKAFEDLADMVGSVNDAQINDKELDGMYGHLDLPTDFVDFVRKTSADINNLLRTVGDNEYILNQMSLDQLRDVNNILTVLTHTVTQTNKALAASHGKSIASLAQDTMLYANDQGKHSKMVGGLTDFFNFSNALPYYAFKRFGDGGRRIFEAFQDGWDKFAFNVKQIMDYSDKTYTSKEVKEWAEQVHEFVVMNGKEKVHVKMTTAQIMSLYCLQKREQAKGHLIGGGIRVADFKEGKGKVTQPDGVTLQEKDIRNIISKLTARQMDVADRLQEFMNTVCTDWGNEVSMIRFGYRAFGEENYFPISSDTNNLAQDDAKEQQNSLFRLLNMSFTKGTIQNANNRVVVDNIFDVFASHTSDMAKYHALALPVLDAFKWYNYKEKVKVNPQDNNDRRFVTKGVKQSVEKAYGSGAKKYIVQFLRDINGASSGGVEGAEQFAKKLMANYKVASVGANLRVAVLQPTAYIRASVLMDAKYLTKAFTKKPQIDKARKTCGIALWKSLGFYDTNIAKGVAEQIKHEDSVVDKVREGSMKLAEWGDSMTWGYLYNACEAEVKDKRPGLTGKERDEAVAKRLREIIYSTQVVDSTMTRTQMMRNKSSLVQMMTSFMSEPMISYNLLHDCYMQYNADKRITGSKETALKRNGKKIARAMMAYTLTTFASALAGALPDTLRDDDEEKDFVETFFTNAAGNAVSDALGMIPVFKDVVSLFQGYDVTRMDTQMFASVVRAYESVTKAVENGEVTYKTVYTVMKAVSQATGIPLSNLMRDAVAIWNSTIGENYETLKY